MKRSRRKVFLDFLKTALVTLMVAATGSGANAHDVASDPIRIASINALSGIAAPTARLSIAGIRCAVGEINRRGGLLGRPLALMEIDNRSTPIGSKVAADQAVAAGVAAIVGSVWSSHTIAAARVAQAGGVPMISNASTSPEVTRIGDCIFRVCFNDLFQGRVLAELARRDLGLSRAVFFVNITSDYSMGLTSEFRRNFERLGGRVLGQFDYKPDQLELTASLTRTAELAPDMLFIPGYDESGAFVGAARDIGLSAIPLGGDGWGTDKFMERGGLNAREGYFCAHWTPELDSPASRDFLAVYRTFDPQGTPYGDTALAYDAVMLLADAITRAGSVQHGKIRDALAATRQFKGATGEITFGENHGDPLKGAVIMKIEDGKARYLKTIQPR